MTVGLLAEGLENMGLVDADDSAIGPVRVVTEKELEAADVKDGMDATDVKAPVAVEDEVLNLGDVATGAV